MLDDAFLAEFDDRLREVGAPIVEAWAPGCTDEEIDAVLAPLGIDLPEEARRWWRWHNGTRDAAPMAHRNIGARSLLRLEDAADEYSAGCREMRQLFGVDGLLPAVSDKPRIFFACSASGAGAVPVYVQGDIDAPVPALPSIRTLLAAWMQLIETGAWALDGGGAWELHLERVPAHLLRLGIY